MSNIEKLSEPFPKDAVHWRVQGSPYERDGKYSAMALAYIDARDVMDRLDAAVGPSNWQAEYSETHSGRVLCRIGIRINDEWVWKADGAGSTAVEGEKGGISDALKRAAVCWGIGRYLYRLDSPWVPCEVRTKGSNVYWKKWFVDPWTLVKQGSYQEPPAAEKPAEPVDHAAIKERLAAAIGKAETLQALNAIWYHRAANAARAAMPQDVLDDIISIYEQARNALKQHAEQQGVTHD